MGPLTKVGSSARFLCSGRQVISALVPGGPLARIGLSALFGVVIFKASLLWYLGSSIGQSRLICQGLLQWYASDLCSGTREPLAAEYSSAKFVFISSVTLVLDGWGVGCPLAKVGSSAKFGVVQALHLCYGTRGVHQPK